MYAHLRSTAAEVGGRPHPAPSNLRHPRPSSHDTPRTSMRRPLGRCDSQRPTPYSALLVAIPARLRNKPSPIRRRGTSPERQRFATWNASVPFLLPCRRLLLLSRRPTVTAAAVAFDGRSRRATPTRRGRSGSEQSHRDSAQGVEVRDPRGFLDRPSARGFCL